MNLDDDFQVISSCQLVNRVCKTLSTPFLITKVVFAKQLQDIAKLQEVVRHPYFSRQVTELICNLSTIPTVETEFYSEYVRMCVHAEEAGRRHFWDREWAARFDQGCEFIRHLERYHGDATADDTGFGSRAPLVEKGRPGKESNGGTECNNTLAHYDAVSREDRMGCRKGFSSYQRKGQFQSHLMNEDLYLDILTTAVQKLPNLRAIRFIDFCGRAYPGERYTDLCQRLFANMLEPNRWHEFAECVENTGDAVRVLKAISTTGLHFQAVAFGPHPMKSTARGSIPRPRLRHLFSLMPSSFMERKKSTVTPRPQGINAQLLV